MKVRIEDSWKVALDEEFDKDYFRSLTGFVRNEYQNHTVYPPAGLIFNAFDRTPLDQVKVVIIGQDPYHGDGQANGLCFSVNEGMTFPPSLLNVFKEINSDLGLPIPPHGNLERWADQGVLMLNATLTVRAKSPGSHQKKGWEEFTDAVISRISDEREHIVFVLWGAYAQKKGELIDSKKHLVIKSSHPSPFAAHKGFFGSKPFSETNRYLKDLGKEPVKW